MVQQTYLPEVECISKSRNLELESELQEKVYFDLHMYFFVFLSYRICYNFSKCFRPTLLQNSSVKSNF